MLGHANLWEICTLYRKTGTSTNGQPTHGPGIPVNCWITRKTRTLKTQSGTDIQSSAQVTFPAEVIPCVQDKVILPEGTALLVQEVSLVSGVFGQFSHSVAYL